MSKRNPQERNDSGQPEIPRGDIPSHASAPRMPPGAPRLKKGDRVTFDIGEGVDGPPYAMNVRLIDDE